MNATQRVLALTLVGASGVAQAGFAQVPEPETLGLLAVGAVALFVARAIRNRK